MNFTTLASSNSLNLSMRDQAVRAIEMAAQRLRDRNLRQRIEEKRAARARGDGDIGGLDAEIDLLTAFVKQYYAAASLACLGSQSMPATFGLVTSAAYMAP